MRECLSVEYLEFFSAQHSLESGDVPLMTRPLAGMVEKKAPSLSDQWKDHTNILELTQKVLQSMNEDPVFYGNKISLICDDLAAGEKMPMSVVVAYLVYFSTPVFIHVLYSILASFIESTVSHVIDVYVRRVGLGAEVEVRTNTLPGVTKDLNEVTDLTLVSVFAEYSEPMMAFAASLAETNALNPAVTYSGGDGILSVFLRIGVNEENEGNFHYRDPYENLEAILGEANAIYQSVLMKWSESLYKEKQG